MNITIPLFMKNFYSTQLLERQGSFEPQKGPLTHWGYLLFCTKGIMNLKEVDLFLSTHYLHIGIFLFFIHFKDWIEFLNLSEEVKGELIFFKEIIRRDLEKCNRKLEECIFIIYKQSMLYYIIKVKSNLYGFRIFVSFWY